MIPGFTSLIAPGSWPLRDSSPPQIALPSTVLAYTTGDLRPWRSIWNRNQHAENLLDGKDNVQSDERPAGWTVDLENALQVARQNSNNTIQQILNANYAETDQSRRLILIDGKLLKCALLAVTLPQVFIKTVDSPEYDNNQNPLQKLLERGGWHHLVSVAFRTRLQASQWDQQICKTAHDWLLCASEVISEPHPIEQRRILWFDLKLI
ncbi:hypothetical protein ACFOGQ_10975 [Acinetobacter vivianii]